MLSTAHLQFYILARKYVLAAGEMHVLRYMYRGDMAAQLVSTTPRTQYRDYMYGVPVASTGGLSRESVRRMLGTLRTECG